MAYDIVSVATPSGCARLDTWSYRLIADPQGGSGETSATSGPEPGQAVPGSTGYACNYFDRQSSLQGGLWQISDAFGHSCQVTLTASPSLTFKQVWFTTG